MDALFSAFAPSVATSLASGASGALEGQMAGEDRVLKNDLLKAQAQWQQAHAANYGQRNRMSMDAMSTIQQKLQTDPNFLSSPHGRLLSSLVGHVDLGVNDARIGAYEGSEAERQALADRRGAEQNRIESLLPWEQNLLKARQFNQTMQGGLAGQRAGDIGATQPGRIDRTAALAEQARSIAKMQKLHGDMFSARTKAIQDANNPAMPQGIKNKTQHIIGLTQQIESMLMNPEFDPDGNPMDAWRMDMAQTTLKALLEPGPEVLMGGIVHDIPVASRGPNAGQVVTPAQPAVPENKRMLLPDVPAKEAIPKTPTTRLPTNPAPLKQRSARPGSAEYDQSVLKGRKLIRARGQKFVEDQLTTNKALTPTEKLALQRALEMSGINE